MGENAIADLIDYLSANGPPDNMKESECQLILRALRLLAAAEANDGSAPETDELVKFLERESGMKADTAVDEKVIAFIKTKERERNALAARVAELEHAVDLAARTMAGEGVEDQGQAWDKCLRILDAERSK